MQTTKTKQFPGGETTASIQSTGAGLHRVTVITRFDSGNFITELDEKNLSFVAAQGLLALYTE